MDYVKYLIQDLNKLIGLSQYYYHDDEKEYEAHKKRIKKLIKKLESGEIDYEG